MPDFMGKCSDAGEEYEDHYCMARYLIEGCLDHATLSALREMRDDLQDYIEEISDRISKMKAGSDEKKYTLKQLRQAWAAGKSALKENQ